MREHMGLFRGKRIDNGEWVEGWFEMYPFGRWPVKASIIPSQEAIEGHYEHAEVDPTTIGECTGLRDKNGKLIFEGDIIKSWQGKILTVKFGQHYDEEEMHNGCGWYVTGEYGTLSFDERWGGHEVIGNIHDNPELLKGGEQ